MERTEKDESLINKIINGDRKAEEILYSRCKKLITKFIVNKYPFNYDTEDDVSDILIKIFERINTFDSEKSQFNTWVVNISNNHMIDKSRKLTYTMITNTNYFSSDDTGKISLDSFNDTSCFVTPTTSFSVDNSLEINDSLNYIENKIGIQDFHLLNMKYKEGYDYEEMATEMRVSSSTLSNRVNYIKSKLKRGK